MKNLLRFNVLILMLVMQFSLTAETLKDPTRPKNFKLNADNANEQISDDHVQGLKLQSLILKRTGNKAIISGRLYAEGAQIGEYKLTKITADKVYLSNDIEQLILELYKYEIKH